MVLRARDGFTDDRAARLESGEFGSCTEEELAAVPGVNMRDMPGSADQAFEPSTRFRN